MEKYLISLLILLNPNVQWPVDTTHELPDRGTKPAWEPQNCGFYIFSMNIIRQKLICNTVEVRVL